MEEEFEDGEGNVLNRKTYLDMKKQGLLDWFSSLYIYIIH